jgi:hypothetical protein
MSMNQAELLPALASRAHVSETDARAVLDALADLATPPSRAATPRHDDAGDPTDAATVSALIARARVHPLGIDYLRRGYLGSVAATFEAHAFTVLAARERLG